MQDFKEASAEIKVKTKRFSLKKGTIKICFELPEEKLPEAVAFIQACMDAQPFPEMDVPIVAEAAYGPDFGHMKEME